MIQPRSRKKYIFDMQGVWKWSQYDNKVSMAGIQKKQVEVIQAGSGGMSFKTGAPKKKGEEQGRNDDCACGSGKKYKKCCGAIESIN